MEMIFMNFDFFKPLLPILKITKLKYDTTKCNPLQRKKQQAAMEHLTAAKDNIQTPQFKNLLPFLVIKGIYYVMLSIPQSYKAYRTGKEKNHAAKF